MDAPAPTPGAAEFRDAVDHPNLRGRGAGLNPGSRFEDIRLHVLGEFLDEQAAEHPGGARVPTRVYEDDSRTIINRVESPDISFSWTINPYRGCEHGCIYCYARPGHEYFGLSSGLDFETKIFAKTRAPELLRAELASPKWSPETIVMSGVTDPYQPVERRLRITRGCLEVLAECRQPVALITKNALILRDLDLLTELNRHGAVRAAISLTTLDNALASKLEPRASSPRERLGAIRTLADAGIPVTVMTAPMIPAINDREMPALLKAAAEAGATTAGYTLMRLPYQIKALFLEWLQRHVPERAAHVESLIRGARGGKLYDATPGIRHSGTGEYAAQLGRTFSVFAKRFRLNRPGASMNTAAFIRPDPPRDPRQPGLFG
ncbi:MAG: PA0069 family radical SAM protein [Phycisphaerales bacterium]